MQFASGVPPPTVKANDLPSEVSDAVAHAEMASSMAAWLSLHIDEPLVQETETEIHQLESPALTQLMAEMNATEQRLAPLIAALETEAFVHFKPPCDSDYPMPAACPLYPRHPNKPKKSPTPQSHCSCKSHVYRIHSILISQQ